MEDRDLEWHIEGTQDFVVRMSKEIAKKSPGATILSADIKLQKRVGNKPEVWQDVNKVPDVVLIVEDNFDEDNPIASNALYFFANADPDGDPVPGLEYRWHVLALLSTGLHAVAKPTLAIIP